MYYNALWAIMQTKRRLTSFICGQRLLISLSECQLLFCPSADRSSEWHNFRCKQHTLAAIFR